MGFSAENVKAWADVFDGMSKSRAERPYLKDLAKANRDLSVSKADMSMIDVLTQGLKNRSDIAHTNALTGLTNEQSKYFGPSALSDIALNNERAKYFGPTANAEINWRNTEADKNKQDTKFAPLKYLLETMNQKKKVDRFGPAYELSRYLNSLDPSSRAAWISANQGEYNRIIGDVANNALNPEESKQNVLLDNVIKNYFPENLTLSDSDQNKMINAGMGGKPPMNPNGASNGAPTFSSSLVSNLDNQPQRLPMPKGFTSSPELIATMQRAAQATANRKLVTASTQRQLEGAQQVESILNDPGLQQKVKSASSFAGAWGKGKEAISALSQKNPQAYEDYRSLIKHDMVLLGNRIKTLDQMGATDAQREELTGMYSQTMDSAFSNPAQFIEQFNQLGKALDRVAKGVEKSASPVFDLQRTNGFKPIGGNAEIQQTKTIDGVNYHLINGKWMEE